MGSYEMISAVRYHMAQERYEFAMIFILSRTSRKWSKYLTFEHQIITNI